MDLFPKVTREEDTHLNATTGASGDHTVTLHRRNLVHRDLHRVSFTGAHHGETCGLFWSMNESD